MLQLAAALQWCDGEARDQGFVCLDDRLRSTASTEEFHVLLERFAAGIEVEGSR
jgi:hypothetical protein